MILCPSAIATAAIFTALIINDVINSNYTPITLHLLGGFFTVLGIMTLCQRIGDYAGWLLLLIPMVIILIGFFLEWYSSSGSKSDSTITYGPSPGPCFMPCRHCGYCNPCRCRKRIECPKMPSIGSNLPKNTQESTLGKC